MASGVSPHLSLSLLTSHFSLLASDPAPPAAPPTGAGRTLAAALRRAGAHPGVGPLALCDARRLAGRLLAVERLAGGAPGRGAARHAGDVVEADLPQELRRAQRAHPGLAD